MKNRTAYCFVSISPVRKEARDQSEMVSELLFGELVEVISMDEPWARITTFSDRYEGYIDHKHIKFLSEKEVRRWTEGQVILHEREISIETPWGKQHICRGSFITSDSHEFRIGNDSFAITKKPDSPFDSVFGMASDYLNTPYLWGGKTPFGIDCSGLTQICYRIFGINLPRDAYEQAEHGLEVDFHECREGDAAFFSNKAGKIIHVGIIGPDNIIVHASGHVRIDKLTEEGIYRIDIDSITHSLTLIRRFS